MKAEAVATSLGGRVVLVWRDPDTRRPVAVSTKDVAFSPGAANDLATDMIRVAEQARLGKDGYFDNEDRWQSFDAEGRAGK